MIDTTPDEVPEDIDVSNVAPLVGGLNLNDLMSNGGTTFEIQPDDLFEQDPYEQKYGEELLRHNFLSECFDSDSNDESDCDLSPFEKLAKKMESIEPNGYVKKRVLNAGNGEKIPENALVTIHYDGFLEYNDEPYDTTLGRYPRSYRLGNGNLILGLEIGIATMECREIAQFIIHPNYAFGALGCPFRIPPNSYVMFRVEVIKFLDSISADMYERMQEEDKKKFSTNRKLAETYQNKAKDMFKLSNFKGAIKNYNRAINILEEAHLANIEEQEIQQKVLLKLYTNLMICHNRCEAYKKACTAFNRITGITANKSLSITPKAYLHHSRALIGIGEYQRAKQELEMGKKLAPACKEILQECCRLESIIVVYKKEERKLAQTMLKTENESAKVVDITELNPVFVEKIRDFLQKFKESDDVVQEVPDGLNSKELNFIKMEAENLNFEFVSNKEKEKYVFSIYKKM